MPTIIAYDILVYSSRSTFVAAINKLISEGWQPLGPAVKFHNSNYYPLMESFARKQRVDIYILLKD